MGARPARLAPLPNFLLPARLPAFDLNPARFVPPTTPRPTRAPFFFRGQPSICTPRRCARPPRPKFKLLTHPLGPPSNIILLTPAPFEQTRSRPHGAFNSAPWTCSCRTASSWYVLMVRKFHPVGVDRPERLMQSQYNRAPPPAAPPPYPLVRIKSNQSTDAALTDAAALTTSINRPTHPNRRTARPTGATTTC